MQKSDQDIVQMQFAIAINRSQQVYRQLFLLFYKPLIAFSYTITKSKEASEEIYSDLFIKLWNMEDDLIKIEHLKVYLYRSIKNASLNYIAKVSKQNIVDIDSIPTDTLSNNTNPENLLLDTELKDRLSKAVAALPPKCQLVFKLIKEESMSYKQVSEVMEISVNTIEGHMTSALKKISQSLLVYKRG